MHYGLQLFFLLFNYWSCWLICEIYRLSSCSESCCYVLRYVALCGVVLCCVVFHWAVLCCVVWCCFVLCFLFYVMLVYAVMWCVVLYFVLCVSYSKNWKIVLMIVLKDPVWGNIQHDNIAEQSCYQSMQLCFVFHFAINACNKCLEN